MKKIPLVFTCFILLGLLSCSNSSGSSDSSGSDDSNTGSSVLISSVSQPNLSLKRYETPVVTVITPEIHLENAKSYSLQYDWFIDFKPISDFDSEIVQIKDESLILDYEFFNDDVHQVDCKLDVYDSESKFVVAFTTQTFVGSKE